MKKVWPAKNTWQDCLINYIPERIRKSVGGFKDKIVSLFKTHLNKLCVGEETKSKAKEKQNTKQKSFYIKKEKKKK